MTVTTRSRGEHSDADIARRNYAIFCSIATAVMVGIVGGVIALFLQ